MSDATSFPKPTKQSIAKALLLRGSVFVHLDPRARAGAHVPQRFRLQPQLVLQIGLNMPVPIPDLRVDDDGIFGTLSFKGKPFFCVVPWDSVFALVADDGKGMTWDEHMPAEVKVLRDEAPSSSPSTNVVRMDDWRARRARTKS